MVYRMTPRRRAALRKAQLASARKRKGSGKKRRIVGGRKLFNLGGRVGYRVGKTVRKINKRAQANRKRKVYAYEQHAQVDQILYTGDNLLKQIQGTRRMHSRRKSGY
jgi:hypothetical protein